MTVAMPILSACGHETCILPTALLSTHTGGFGKPTVVHLNDALDGMWQHWRENEITFDAILVGYLGSIPAIEMTRKILEHLLAPGGLAIVDPAMADHGKLYSGFDEAYARAMEGLCRKADIILPNVTEAAMFSGFPYCEQLTEAYVRELLHALKHPKVILTGVGYREGETGAAAFCHGIINHYHHPKIDRNFHGTGDMFAASFTGALMQGKTMEESIKIAGDFVCKAIENTVASPAHWYGVKFETALPDLIHRLQK
jgi:pyridoxine kinase